MFCEGVQGCAHQERGVRSGHEHPDWVDRAQGLPVGGFLLRLAPAPLCVWCRQSQIVRRYRSVLPEDEPIGQVFAAQEGAAVGVWHEEAAIPT